MLRPYGINRRCRRRLTSSVRSPGSLVRPDVALVTNVLPVHLGQFASEVQGAQRSERADRSSGARGRAIGLPSSANGSIFRGLAIQPRR